MKEEQRDAQKATERVFRSLHGHWVYFHGKLIYTLKKGRRKKEMGNKHARQGTALPSPVVSATGNRVQRESCKIKINGKLFPRKFSKPTNIGRSPDSDFGEG